MNLIYDRTAADVERALALAKKAEAGTLTDAEKAEWLAGMKGCYNAADMNRVEAAVQTLAAELRKYGYSVEYTDRTYPHICYVDTDYLVNAKWTGASGNNYAGFARNLILSGSTLSGIVWCASDSSNNTISFTSYNVDIGQSKSYAWNGINDTATKLSSFALNDGNNTISIENGSMSVDENKISFLASFPIKAGTYEIIINVSQSGSAARMTIPFEIKEVVSREWRESDIVRLSQWRQYLANVQALRDAYYTLGETGQLPDAADRLDYIGANNIEKILADIDLLIDCMKSSYRRCGTFQAGNNAAHLPLKGSV